MPMAPQNTDENIETLTATLQGVTTRLADEEQRFKCEMCSLNQRKTFACLQKTYTIHLGDLQDQALASAASIEALCAELDVGVDGLGVMLTDQTRLCSKAKFLALEIWLARQYLQALNALRVADCVIPVIRKRRANLDKGAKKILMEWFEDHVDNPYPVYSQKEQLAEAADITVEQTTNWFINARVRLEWSGSSGKNVSRKTHSSGESSRKSGGGRKGSKSSLSVSSSSSPCSSSSSTKIVPRRPQRQAKRRRVQTTFYAPSGLCSDADSDYEDSDSSDHHPIQHSSCSEISKSETFLQGATGLELGCGIVIAKKKKSTRVATATATATAALERAGVLVEQLCTTKSLPGACDQMLLTLSLPLDSSPPRPYRENRDPIAEDDADDEDDNDASTELDCDFSFAAFGRSISLSPTTIGGTNDDDSDMNNESDSPFDHDDAFEPLGFEDFVHDEDEGLVNFNESLTFANAIAAVGQTVV